MLQHTLILVFRSFKRARGAFLINLIGLSTGLAGALLIFLWVDDEMGIDRFHENDARLYQVMTNFPEGDRLRTITPTTGLLAQTLMTEMPEVEWATAVIPPDWFSRKGVFSVGEGRIKADAQYVDEQFFHVFSYPLIQGDRDQVLRDKQAVLLSDVAAMRLFNTTDGLIGRTITWDQGRLSGEYIITGIFKAPPPHSTAQFEALFSYARFLDQYPNSARWLNNDPATYLVLKAGTDAGLFNEKIREFIKRKNDRSRSTLFIQPYGERYLHGTYENGAPTGGRIEYVRLFALIAAFILLIACINFMNLATARAAGRMMEIGVKKAVGATRKALAFQHLGESVLMSFLSLATAVVLIDLCLPAFNGITGKQITLDPSPAFIFAVLGITFLTGLIAGSYPALYLSGFRPSLVLKGMLPGGSGALWARKGLVVFQFSISVILIVSVLVISGQIDYIQTRQLGYDRDHLLYFKNDGALKDRLETFLAEIKTIPGVVAASGSGHHITGGHGRTPAVEWPEKRPDERIVFGNLAVGYDFIETLDIDMEEGRAFSRAFGNERDHIIFNESAIAAMGLEDPIGKTVRLWGEEKMIVGVVRDFHFESLYEDIKPAFLQWQSNLNTTIVKFQAGAVQKTLSDLEQAYQRHNPGLPFEFRFLDDDFQMLYAAEQRVAVLSRYFAGMAILISCLGLFGLAAFTAQKRRKEIGIRKTLGAGSLRIIAMLSADFTKMVVAALVIAWPVGYIIAGRWLDGFAYRIALDPWYFVMAGAAALAIAWITTGIQAIQAARLNPVQCLRDE